MKPVRTFAVVPSLPAALEPLRDIAYDLSWVWNHEALQLFRRLDPDLWESTEHNPVRMLGSIDQSRLNAAANDEGFVAHLRRVAEQQETYRGGESTWFGRTYGVTRGPLIAYFSAEFGITESLSIFAGGLGLLAGDHLKSCSDLGVPLVGVGLLYQEGYFRQRLNEAGRQQEVYENNDFYNLPLVLERGSDGVPLTVQVACPGREVHAQIWRAQVGRVALYLLDTNSPLNSLEDRVITQKLYGGDRGMRIKQEMLLGIGGFRALQRLGLDPAVYHINEGHSAFLTLERVRHLMHSEGLSFDVAREAASAGFVFTTHTPVAAGHDYFSPALIGEHFSEYARELGLSLSEFLALGRQNADDEEEQFCMTVLALRMSADSNGVSKLHGQVTRRMWQGLWPGVPEEEMPIGHITNGVHCQSWTSREMNELYERYLGARWREEPADATVWEAIERVPAVELWRTHERRRERLVLFARRSLREQLRRLGAPPSEQEGADEVLNPEALIIGFSRRFATYKRGTLLLRNPERLAQLLGDPERPVQVIFSGKAHPQDEDGKELIRQIVTLSREEPFRGRLIFLEDYGLNIARHLVQGCDVWLNTPQRPLEASGTSGMKAAANGVLHLSTLDGWWDEAWRENEGRAVPIGWAIGRGETYDDSQVQDDVEAEALYELLEQDVIPAFYDRGSDGLPRRWIARMKSCISSLCHFFNTHRMVQEYAQRFYLPSAARYQRMRADGFSRSADLASWKARVRQQWSGVRVQVMDGLTPATVQVGDRVAVKARLWLPPGLGLDDVAVELYVGRVGPQGNIEEAQVAPMRPAGREGDAYVLETDSVASRSSGVHGYTVRARPSHPEMNSPFLPGLITWATAPE